VNAGLLQEEEEAKAREFAEREPENEAKASRTIEGLQRAVSDARKRAQVCQGVSEATCDWRKYPCLTPFKDVHLFLSSNAMNHGAALAPCQT
jgi:hypothetical protein